MFWYLTIKLQAYHASQKLRRNPTDNNPGDNDPNSDGDEGNAPGDDAPENSTGIGAVLRTVLEWLTSLEERLEDPRRGEDHQQEVVDGEDGEDNDNEIAGTNDVVEEMQAPVIAGYKRDDRRLNKQEWEFYQQMKTLGITDATVHELFSQGYQQRVVCWLYWWQCEDHGSCNWQEQ